MIFKQKAPLLILLLIGYFSLLMSMEAAGASSTIPPDPEYGGFLMPHDGDVPITQGIHEINALDFGGSFEILAPKDGVIVDFNDDMYSLFNAGCALKHGGVNYLILGHGPFENGQYHHYSVMYHLAKDSVTSLGWEKNDRVRLGQVIAKSGNTGYVESLNGGTGTHLHFFVTDSMPKMGEQLVIDCLNTYGEDGDIDFRKVPLPGDERVSWGLEETTNQWYPSTNTSNSYNPGPFSFPGWAIPMPVYDEPPQICDPSTHDVILYNHIDYGGECLRLNDGDTFRIDEVNWLNISSIFINTDNGCYATAYEFDYFSGERTAFLFSSPDLRNYGGENWSDRIGWLHVDCSLVYPTYLKPIGGFILEDQNNLPDWLLEFSFEENLPLEVKISTKIDASDPNDYDSHRVLIDGNEIFQTSASEYNHTWNTYEFDDGYHTITVEYLLDSHNGNWANALVYDEVEFFLSSNRDSYVPCNQISDGATLTSGNECIGVTQDVGDLMPVHWQDRPDLQVCAVGNVSVWAYDGVLDNWGNFSGIPKVVDSGQCKNVGDNVSSIDIQENGGIVGPLPDTLFGTPSDTIVHYRFDNSTIDEAGNYNGSLTNSATYLTGKFGSSLYVPNPPDGSGMVAGAFDLNSFTLDIQLSRPIGSTGGRVICQLGGGGNIGQNKWCLHLNGNRPELEIWSAGGSQKLQSPYDLLDDGSWHYINVSYDGIGSAVMYVDNIYAGTLTTAGVMNAGATTFEIGMGEGIYSCNCQIDELRIRSGVHQPEVGVEIPPTPTPVPTATSTPAPNLLTGTFDSLDDSSCGGIRSIANTWPHSQSDVRDSDGCQNVNYISAYLNAGSYFMQRGYTSFDTSSIPVDAEIVSATVNLYIHDSNFTNANSTTLELVQATQGSSLGLGDFSNIGDTSFASVPLASIQQGAVNSFALSGNIESLINKGGTSQIGLRLGLDLNDQTPTGLNSVKAWLEPGANGMQLLVSYTEPSYTPTATSTPSPVPSSTPSPTVTPTPSMTPTSSSPSPSLTFGNPTNITNTPNDTSRNARGIVDAVGNIHLVYTEKLNGQYEVFYRKWELASGWSSAEPVAITNTWSGSPTIALTSDGTVHIAWFDQSTGNISILTSSKAPGGNWSSPSQVSSSGSGYSAYDPDIVVDNNDTLHLVWWQAGTPSGCFHSSKPLNGSWSGSNLIPTTGVSCLTRSATVDDTGTLHVAFHVGDHNGTARNVYHKSFNGTWSNQVKVSNCNGDNDHCAWPIIDSEGTNLYVAYCFTNPWPNNCDVHYVERINGTWQSPINLSNDSENSTLEPESLKVAQDGAAYVCWWDESYPTNNEKMTCGLKSDGSWTTQDVLTTANRQRWSGLFIDNIGFVYLVYSEFTSGWDLYLSTNGP